MSREFKGSKYEETKSLRLVEIAKLIRQEIKALVANNELPKGKYSVTVRHHTAIDIKITDFEFPILNSERLNKEKEMGNDRAISDFQYPRFTKIASLAKEKLTTIHNQYNYDNSDAMVDHFDVRFYGSVDFDWKLETKERHLFETDNGFLNP